MAHIILLYLLILYTADTVTPLTTDDFYTDDNAPILTSSWQNLPISIYNIKKAEPKQTVIRVRQNIGYLELQTANSDPVLMSIFYATSGESVLKFSTNTTLLAKARKDLSMYDFAPTHLIIHTNINTKVSDSTEGSTFQTVIATNGHYTYAIIQFVQVEPNVANSFSSYIFYFYKAIVTLPYISDKVNAATNSNVGVPGKYIIDMNEKAACRSCELKMIHMACEVNKKLNRTVYSYCS